MAGHSRSKNGVASLAYVPAIHVFLTRGQDVDARDKPGHDGVIQTLLSIPIHFRTQITRTTEALTSVLPALAGVML